MNKKVAFYSYELHPLNNGGCGVFLSHAINDLLDNGFSVVVLLDLNDLLVRKFNREIKPGIKNGDNLVVYCVDTVLSGYTLPVFQNIFLNKSYRAYFAVKKIAEKEGLDYVEFFDYSGIAYFAATSKILGEDFTDGPLIGIRTHCTNDLLDAHESSIQVTADRLVMYSMEKLALQRADVVLIPTMAWGELYRERYGIPAESLKVVQPPLYAIDTPRNIWRHEAKKHILYYNRLFELKGADLFVDAAVQFLFHNPDSKASFVLAGYESMDAPDGGSYREYLIKKIPPQCRSRFHFLGQVTRDQLPSLLKDTIFAVFPNYIESFCYAAHELFMAGIPLILRDIPAFSGFFQDGENAFLFQGGSTSLCRRMEELYYNPGLRERLSKSSVLIEGGFNERYRQIIETGKERKRKSLSSQIGVEKRGTLLILVDKEEETGPAHERFERLKGEFRVIYLLRCGGKDCGSKIRFLGDWYHAMEDKEGYELYLQALDSPVGVFRATDQVEADMVRCLKRVLLSNHDLCGVHPLLVFKDGFTSVPCELYGEMYPFEMGSTRTRAIFRLRGEKRPVQDLFDNRFGVYGEAYLFTENGTERVLPVAGVVLTCQEKTDHGFPVPSNILNANSLSSWNRAGQYAILYHRLLNEVAGAYCREKNTLVWRVLELMPKRFWERIFRKLFL